MSDAADTAVVVNGVRSPVLDSGPRSDEAVVFVHGNPGSRLDWAGLMSHVGSFCRAVALDMPGFGEADKPADFPCTVPGYAAHLAGALEHLEIRRAHLVLHDFGGAWGLAWAATHPTQIGSVTLVNIGVLPGYRWHLMARVWRTPLLGELSMAATTRAAFRIFVGRGNPRLPVEHVDRMYAHLDAQTRRAILRLYRSTSDLDGMSRMLKSTLRPLDVPALVLWGRRDPYVPADYAHCQREVFPRADVRLLDESSHWPFLDDPETVAGMLATFLRAHLRT